MELPPYPAEGYPDEGWPKPTTIRMRENVPVPGHAHLHVDLLHPEDQARPLPAIIWLSGGGWRMGDRRVAMERLFACVEAGFVGIPADYRRSDVARFPAPLDDVRNLTRWVIDSGVDLGVDPRRVVLFGGSSGGHLALLTALTKDIAVAAVIAAFAPTNLLTMDAFPVGVDPALEHASANSPEGLLLGGPPGELAELAREASPITHVHADAPPVLLVHGDADRIVPVGQSHALAAALRAVGADVTYFEHAGGDHSAVGFPPDWMNPVRSWLLETLAR